eukprot:NODE_5301_length_594_cov_162.768089.p2 GENE.NODE_5301_length_594_cov_162.768089~~NODE_5301_length_594_cov_162.768089.p2  ORF type:complete len:177 (+),score=48.59 NODE_5301_length_594_cov_162.768089:3-533(+)
MGVLQASFRSVEKGEHVMAVLAPLLAPHVREARWYLYQTPPLKKLAPRETLAAAGLAPGAGIYLGFDGEKPAPPYLDEPLVAQLGPQPADARGVVARGPTFTGEAMGWGAGQMLSGTAAASTGAPAAAAPAVAAAAAATAATATVHAAEGRGAAAAMEVESTPAPAPAAQEGAATR